MRLQRTAKACSIAGVVWGQRSHVTHQALAPTIDAAATKISA